MVSPSLTYSARHLNPTESNSNGNLTDLVFRFFSRIYTDLHGFPLISTDFYELSRLSTTTNNKIRDYFALLTSFKLKKPPYSNVGLRWRALYSYHQTSRIAHTSSCNNYRNVISSGVTNSCPPAEFIVAYLPWVLSTVSCREFWDNLVDSQKIILFS